MNPDFIFKISNNFVLIGWLLLVFLPRWRWSARLIAPALIPVLLSGLYTTLVIQEPSHSSGGFSSLPLVAQLFQNRAILLAGWVHYLAFDLFVGSWEVRDAQQIGIAHYLVVPCLILTFLLGPAGWLLYFAVRSVATRSLGVNNIYDSAASTSVN